MKARAFAAATILALGVILTPGVGAADSATAARMMDELMWSRGPIGGPFTLVDQTGRTRSDTDFRGKIVVLYFGYTYCPDICPTDLMSITRAIALLGEGGDNVQPIFVSVDPERDTPRQLADYVGSFSPRLVGLTGAPAQVRAVANAYKSYFEKVGDADDAGYLIDHSGVVYFLGRDGAYRGYAPPQTSPEKLAEILRRLLSAN